MLLKKVSARLPHPQSKPDADRWSSFPEFRRTDSSLHPATTRCFDTYITTGQTEIEKVLIGRQLHKKLTADACSDCHEGDTEDLLLGMTAGYTNSGGKT